MPLAVITGGTSGIGFQLARRLRDKGYALFIQGLDDDHLKKAKQRLEKESQSSSRELPPITFLALDFTHPQAANDLNQAVVQYAQKRNIALEVLVNSAGFGLFGDHASLTQIQLTGMLQVNIVALSQLCHDFVGHFARHKKGYILNISSTTAFQPLPFLAAYASSKAYVKQFSLALAQEVEKQGIKVCCVCPGATNTPFLSKAGLDAAQEYTLGQMLNYLSMDPAHVAEAALAGLFGGKKLITPGLINKGHYRAARHIPEPWASKLGKVLLRPKPH